MHSSPDKLITNILYVLLQIQGMQVLSTLSNTFAEIDHEIISTAILVPSADSKRVVVSYKGKYVHKVQY